MTTPFLYAEKESYLVCVWMILIVFEVLVCSFDSIFIMENWLGIL